VLFLNNRKKEPLGYLAYLGVSVRDAFLIDCIIIMIYNKLSLFDNLI
jgi:hypothetical protein